MRTVFALVVRLIRRGTAILAILLGAYFALRVAQYLATYPDAESRAVLMQFDTPAVRMLQGAPRGIDTPGGFTVWDGGYIAQAVTAVWVILLTTRLLRGEEESGRNELVLAGPVRPGRAVATTLAVIGLACMLLGVVTALSLALSRTGTTDSVLYGAALAGFTATCAGIAAVAAQIHAERRRAVQLASSVFAATYLIRVAASSTDERAWLGWATPFGWVDQLHVYAGARWYPLIPLLVAPFLLGAAAVLLRTHRDEGVGTVATEEHRKADLRWLGSPTALAWRGSRGVLAGWAVGLGSYAFLIGALLQSMVDFLNDDPNYRRVLAQIGMDMTHPDGFVAAMATMMGIGFALYACWRMGSARAEEDSARVENILVRPVPRSRWLGGQIVLTMTCTAALATFCGVAIWAGAQLTGAEVSLVHALQSMLNTLPAAAACGGLAVALFGLLPRLTVAGSAGATVIVVIVQMIGPPLGWPGWVVDLSPFHHLAMVPAEAFAVVPALVLLAVAAVMALGGMLAFARRDLVGA